MQDVDPGVVGGVAVILQSVDDSVYLCLCLARSVEMVQAVWTWLGWQVVAWQPWLRSMWYRAQLGWTWWLQAAG